MAKPKTAAQRNAERLADYAKPKAYDAEAEALRLEFEPLALNDFEQAELAEALRLRLGTNADRIASRAILNRLRADLADAVSRVVGEAAELADAKATRDGEAWRILARDGLAELFNRGRITRRQFDGGLAYRRRYELAFKGLRSTLGSQASGVTPTIDEMVRSRTRLARHELERVVVEGLVMKAAPSALVLLRAVAGEGRSINSVLTNGQTIASDLAGSAATRRVMRDRSGKAYDRALGLLVVTLDICALRLPQNAA